MFLAKYKEKLTQPLFILLAMACGFFISADYSIVRPVSNSLFLHNYGSSYLSYAWLLGLPLSFLVVSLYNRYLAPLGCFRMFVIVSSLVVSGNCLTALFAERTAWVTFLHYLWKDAYIMLMFQQLWSVIHSTIPQEKAKYLYGLLFGFGALGSICGSSIPGFLAVKMGSECLLFASLPLYLCLGFSYYFLLRQAKPISFEKKKGEFLQGIKLIGRSRTLFFILTLVIFMQCASTLIDYQFQKGLEENFLDKDLRTQYTGRLFSLVHLSTLCLQFAGTYLVVKWIGVASTHFLVPLVLGLSNLGYLFFPFFGVMTLSYVLIKSCDFSLFTIIKEMLYIPTKPEEKFHAKAVIDVFIYRSSKAVASCLILFLQPHLLSWMTLGLFLVWALLVLRYFQKPSHAIHVGN